MKFDEFRDTVLRSLRDSDKPALTGTELARFLGLRGKERKSLQKWLVRLCREGDVAYSKPNRYSLPPKDEVLEGMLALVRGGSGIVIADGSGGEVFVPEEEVGRALPGDRVQVRLLPVGDESHRQGVAGVRRRLGTVVRIIARSVRQIVGTVRAVGRSLHVTPIDPVFKRVFQVAEAKGARANDRVVIHFTGWDARSDIPDGEILEVLGPADDPSTDTIAIVRHYGFRTDFPEEVNRESECAPDFARIPGARIDLRDRFVFTIDPETARDFDDAVSIEVRTDGTRVLGVHIADVAHFVRPGTALDREARVRGNSVYLPDKVIPMLPESLSNGICSLRPNEDRLTLTAFMSFDPCGRIVKRFFSRTLIRSRLRLTYEQAMALIAGELQDLPSAGGDSLPVGTVSETIRQLHTLAQELRALRFANHALDMDIPESEVMFNPDKSIADIRLVRNDPSHQLIEECMVAANEAVALELEEHGLPIISRLHEPPDEDKINALRATLSGMGYAPGNLHQQRNMAAFLRKVKDQPLGVYVQTAVLRSMKRAIYSAARRGHYGLAKAHYAHFTAPIRRYSDITLHRQLISVLEHSRPNASEGNGATYEMETLSVIATSCSASERMADEAGRALSDILKYRFLQTQIETGHRRIYSAVVIEVVRFGLFVEVLDLHMHGLIHGSVLSQRHGMRQPRHDRAKQSMTVGRATYRPGQLLKVMVTRVDMDRRQVDFVTCDGPIRSTESKRFEA